MNASDIVKIAPGVVRSFDGKRAIYFGTSEALIAAGLVEEKQLPGQAGMARGMCTVGSTQIVARPVPRGTRYEVRVLLSQQRLDQIQAEAHVDDGRCIAVASFDRSPVWPFPISIGAKSLMETRV